MGLDRFVRNEIVEILAARPPMVVFLLKQVWRYYTQFRRRTSDHTRLIWRVIEAVEQLEHGRGTTAMAGLAVVDRWSGPTALYTEAVEWAGDALGASHTLQG